MPLQSLAESLFPLSQTLCPATPESPPHALVPIRATRKLAQWKAGLSQAYAYLSGRTHDPQEQGWLDQHYEKVMQDKPDFARVRRNATFEPAPVIVFSQQAAAEIMKQAREIERESYTERGKGKHGGGIGRMAMQLLEWFCFVMWPKGKYGMYPSLEHIASQARMSKDAVVQALKRLELYGFVTVIHRRKRVMTAFGAKQVQDTNAYVLNLARGLGALALAVIAKGKAVGKTLLGSSSESGKTSAKETIYFKKSYPTKKTPEKGEEYGFWGQLKEAWETS